MAPPLQNRRDMRRLLILLAISLAPAFAAADPSTNQLLAEMNARKPPRAPASPWAVIDRRTTPRPLERARYFESMRMTGCTAAHDHCLPKWTWFVEAGEEDQPVAPVHAAYLLEGQDGLYFGLVGRSQTFAGDATSVAYRTVPATRRHLVRGARVVALAYAQTMPASEEDAVGGSWLIGTVKSVDWSAGTLTMAGSRDPFWISSVRVCVLRYGDGKVTVMPRAPARIEVIAGETVEPPSADADAIELRAELPSSASSRRGDR